MVEATTGEPCSEVQWEAIAATIYDTLEYTFSSSLEDLDGDVSRFENQHEYDITEPEKLAAVPDGCEGFLFSKSDVEGVLGSEISLETFFAIANVLISEFQHQFEEDCRTQWPEIDQIVADRS